MQFSSVSPILWHCTIIVFSLTCLSKILNRFVWIFFTPFSWILQCFILRLHGCTEDRAVENQGILILSLLSLVIFSHLPQWAANYSLLTLLCLFLEYLFPAPNTWFVPRKFLAVFFHYPLRLHIYVIIYCYYIHLSSYILLVLADYESIKVHPHIGTLWASKTEHVTD